MSTARIVYSDFIFMEGLQGVLLLWIFFILFCLCNIVLSVSCSLVVINWDFLALLYVMFSCVFVTFPYGILGQVLYLIVSIPDLCLLTLIYTKLLLMVCKIIQLFQIDYMTL